MFLLLWNEVKPRPEQNSRLEAILINIYASAGIGTGRTGGLTRLKGPSRIGGLSICLAGCFPGTFGLVLVHVSSPNENGGFRRPRLMTR